MSQPTLNNQEYELYTDETGTYKDLMGTYTVQQDEIDINDYIPADEETEFNNFTSLLNIFTCYFKQLFSKNQESTMLDDVDYTKTDSTNKCMEFMYEEMFKFNKSLDLDKDILYHPDDECLDINKCTELYVLYVDSEPKYTCKYLLPLMQYIGTLRWTTIDWSIIKIKD